MSSMPPPRRPVTFHIVAFAAVSLLSAGLYLLFRGVVARLDRKSTRLNSSH